MHKLFRINNNLWEKPLLTAKDTTPSVVRGIETGATFSARFFTAVLATNPTAQIKWPQATGATILAHRNFIVLFLRIPGFPETLNNDKLLLAKSFMGIYHILIFFEIFCIKFPAAYLFLLLISIIATTTTFLFTYCYISIEMIRNSIKRYTWIKEFYCIIMK